MSVQGLSAWWGLSCENITFPQLLLLTVTIVHSWTTVLQFWTWKDAYLYVVKVGWMKDFIFFIKTLQQQFRS